MRMKPCGCIAATVVEAAASITAVVTAADVIFSGAAAYDPLLPMLFFGCSYSWCCCCYHYFCYDLPVTPCQKCFGYGCSRCCYCHFFCLFYPAVTVASTCVGAILILFGHLRGDLVSKLLPGMSPSDTSPSSMGILGKRF